MRVWQSPCWRDADPEIATMAVRARAIRHMFRDKGTLVVGITNFEPMDYKDESGEWIGFDADLAREFAESLGVDAEFVEIDWDNKIMELEGKTIDCVWNGMTLITGGYKFYGMHGCLP